MLFDTFVTTVWKPSCAKLRECTKVGYESALNCHILPQWSGRDMDAISVADIESWLDSFDRPGAARKAYAVFRAILRLAFKRGLSDNDVTRREIRLPHLRHYEPQVLSAPEVRRLLKGFYGHPLEAWLLVSVCAGLRRSIQFEHRIAWRRSAGGAAHHRLAFLGKDDSKRKLGMGRRLYHGATLIGD